ncbi:hypothetical protein J1N35_042015 [Gossypium stocksii]|uniref:Uncharacterized protein n=1 Tax=Gossypium stocksii TaxID=47602 RepID=A0A9D3ZJU1_9ROSI|nr:hypothetical protein J1N35_042015 [Gossypium stocksii]
MGGFGVYIKRGMGSLGRQGNGLETAAELQRIWWEGGEILGGRDGQSGGTWLASSRDGRLAFITNFRELQSIPQAKSRGNFPVDFLQWDAIIGVDEENSSCGIICPRTALGNSLGINP